MTFALYQEKEIKPPDPNKKNEVVYFTDGCTLYMKTIFRESPLLPGGAVFVQKPRSGVVCGARSEAQEPVHSARLMRKRNPKSWALVAVNLGPPRQDLVAPVQRKARHPAACGPASEHSSAGGSSIDYAARVVPHLRHG